jgi:hypothetical protein
VQVAVVAGVAALQVQLLQPAVTTDGVPCAAAPADQRGGGLSRGGGGGGARPRCAGEQLETVAPITHSTPPN